MYVILLLVASSIQIFPAQTQNRRECIVLGGSRPMSVFVYMGEGGEIVAHDVVRVRVDPSVTSIPAEAFSQRKNLTEVELGVVDATIQ